MTGPRAVLDTNVWLDWLVFDDPSTAPIKAAVAASRAEVLIDAACEAELERALGYDLGKRTVDVAACIAECRRRARRARGVSAYQGPGAIGARAARGGISHPRARGLRRRLQETASSSTSKVRVAFGGMVSPAPASP